MHLLTTAFHQVERAMAFALHQLDHQAQLQAKHYLKIMICELVETEKSNMRLNCYMLSLARDQP